jgi:hypothetical protein
MSSPFVLNREKYLEVMRREGLARALTLLQQDLSDMEWESFDSHLGYRPEAWESMKAFREFSQYLWNQRTEPSTRLKADR